MKIKNLVMLFALGAFAFTSCNKDDNGGIETSDGNFDMYIKFEGLDGTTKAEADRVGDQTDATLTTGMLFFAESNGKIVRKVEISNYAIPGGVTPQQLADGKLFEDINENAAFVHVFGNHDFQQTYYDNISEVEAETVTLLSQTNSVTWGVENANLYGRGPIVAAGSTPGSKAPATATKEAIFEITPLIARLEIEKISGDLTKGIVSFDVEDIFIHNFYEKVTPAGALLPAPDNAPWVVSTFLQDYTRYAPKPAGDYETTWKDYLYDAGMSSSSDASGSVVPASGAKVWAYNTLANAGADPHIIIRLSNVKLDSSSTLPKDASDMYQNPITNNSDAYLTITGYRNGSGKVDVVGGNIYRLSNVLFNDGDLGETPYPGDDLEKVWVEVTVKKWTLINVEPEFN